MSQSLVTKFQDYADRLERDYQLVAPHWPDDLRINEAHPTIGEIKQVAKALPAAVLSEITAERQRQIAKGYDAAHDDEHLPDEIATAAASYAIGSDSMYPWGRLPEGSRRGQMVIAAALLVAAIERLDRASKP